MSQQRVVFKEAEFDPLFNPLKLTQTSSTLASFTTASTVTFHQDDTAFESSEKMQDPIKSVPIQEQPQHQQQETTQSQPQHRVTKDQMKCQDSEEIITQQANPKVESSPPEEEEEEDLFTAQSETNPTSNPISPLSDVPEAVTTAKNVKTKKQSLFDFDEEDHNNKSIQSTLVSQSQVAAAQELTKLDEDLFIVDDDKLERLLHSVNNVSGTISESDIGNKQGKAQSLFDQGTSSTSEPNIGDDFDFSSYVQQQSASNTSSLFDFDTTS